MSIRAITRFQYYVFRVIYAHREHNESMKQKKTILALFYLIKAKGCFIYIRVWMKRDGDQYRGVLMSRTTYDCISRNPRCCIISCIIVYWSTWCLSPVYYLFRSLCFIHYQHHILLYIFIRVVWQIAFRFKKKNCVNTSTLNIDIIKLISNMLYQEISDQHVVNYKKSWFYYCFLLGKSSIQRITQERPKRQKQVMDNWKVLFFNKYQTPVATESSEAPTHKLSW